MIELPPGATISDDPIEHDDVVCPTTVMEDYRNRLSGLISELAQVEMAGRLQVRGSRVVLQDDENDLRDEIETRIHNLIAEMGRWTARERGQERD